MTDYNRLAGVLEDAFKAIPSEEDRKETIKKELLESPVAYIQEHQMEIYNNTGNLKTIVKEVLEEQVGINTALALKFSDNRFSTEFASKGYEDAMKNLKNFESLQELVRTLNPVKDTIGTTITVDDTQDNTKNTIVLDPKDLTKGVE